MEDILVLLITILLVLLVLSIGYFVWVGIFWLINAVFGTQFNIWLGGILGIVLASFFSSSK
jgi:hypothetical protein